MLIRKGEVLESFLEIGVCDPGLLAVMLSEVLKWGLPKEA